VRDQRLVPAISAAAASELAQRVTAGAATVRGVLDDLSGSPLDRQLLARARAVLADTGPAVDAYEQLLGYRSGMVWPALAARVGEWTEW
jgi:hypothetical protein